MIFTQRHVCPDKFIRPSTRPHINKTIVYQL